MNLWQAWATQVAQVSSKAIWTMYCETLSQTTRIEVMNEEM